MELLLWAFVSLQVSLPLPNVSSWQRPGLDTNGPFWSNLNPPTRFNEVRVPRDSKLYTCQLRGTVERCRFNNGMYYKNCRFEIDDIHTIPCAQMDSITI